MSLFIRIARKNALKGHLFCLRGGFHEIGEDSCGILTDKSPVRLLVEAYQKASGWCLQAEGSQTLELAESEHFSLNINDYSLTARMSKRTSDAMAFCFSDFGVKNKAGKWIEAKYCQITQKCFVPLFCDFTIGSSPLCGMCIPLNNLTPIHAILRINQHDAVLTLPNGSILSRGSINDGTTTNLTIPPLDLELKILGKC